MRRAIGAGARALGLAAAALLVASAGGCRAEEPRDTAPASAARPSSASSRAAARPERLGVGRLATRDEVAAWDRDVDASGHGLPPGRGTAAAGAPLYATRCAA